MSPQPAHQAAGGGMESQTSILMSLNGPGWGGVHLITVQTLPCLCLTSCAIFKMGSRVVISA